MNALLLLAALSSQITFNTTQQGDMYTIIPEVTLTQSCLCRVQILSEPPRVSWRVFYL